MVFLTFYSIKTWQTNQSGRVPRPDQTRPPPPHRVQHSRCLTAANQGVLILTGISQGRREKLICINKDGGRRIAVGAVGEFFGKRREVTAATQHCPNTSSVSAELKLNLPCPFFPPILSRLYLHDPCALPLGSRGVLCSCRFCYHGNSSG